MTGPRRRPVEIFYPEVAAGGFTRVDSSVAFYLRINALLTKEMIVVDLGAGRGAAHDERPDFRTALRSLRGKCRRVIGADIDEAVLSNPSVDEAVLVARDGTIPLADLSVDLIFADFTFEHVVHPEKFCAEIDRILKPGGWICARTPNKWGYIGLAARLVPNRAHVGLLRFLQPERRDVDVFPTAYRLNTKRALRTYFPDRTWERYAYAWNAEPAYFGRSVVAWAVMLALFRLLPASLGAVLFFYGRKRT